MKKFWETVSIALICGMLTTPQIDARGRENNTYTTQSSQSGQRPTTGSNNNTQRPGNSSNAPKPGGNNNTQRPGNSNNAPKPDGNNNTQRPGNSNNAPKPGSNNNTQRPGNSNNAPKPGGNNNTQRPGNSSNAPKPGSNNNTQRPGNSSNAPKPGSNNNTQRPGNSNNAPKPGGNKDSHNSHINRPHCPPTTVYHRPTPPASFRPSKSSPSFRAIFGITLGSTINISLDFLKRNSYDINGYGNDIIYLRNVTEYGYMWPDATLYYEANRLVGTQLIYSTNYNSHNRYNMVYNTLTNQYGNPIDIRYVTNGMIATWWGYDGQYITLEYHPTYTNNGQLRYITTLSFGN